VIIAILVIAWGFVSIDDSINNPLAMGASWQVSMIIVLFGGMILGAAINNLLRLRVAQRNPGQ
jgi:hypothetical protein